MSQPVPSTGKTILVADDEVDMQKILERRLASWGYACLWATNGREAVRLTQERKPDLVLLDVMMPEMDGLAACRALKDSEETRRIPVVLLTAKDSRQLPADVEASGANGFLRKPYEASELLQTIQQALGNSHQ